MRAILTIAGLTLREARRRRLVLVGALLGCAFVLVYATALWFIVQNSTCGPRSRPCATPFQTVQFHAELNILALMGLYVANFLALITAVLLPVDTLSGEMASGVTQTLASKPIRRADIVLGKWLAYGVLAALFVVITAGGIVAAMWTVTAVATGGRGIVPPGVPRGLVLMILEVTVMLTVSIAGGTRFSTVTNGMVALGIFGLGFLGGWVEQIGVMLVQGETGRTLIRNIGTIVSLLVPADALWRLAAYHMLPPIARDLGLTPFTSMYPPSYAMVVWALAYIAATVVFAIRSFDRRAL
jgi:Cu-processing system permease protein